MMDDRDRRQNKKMLKEKKILPFDIIEKKGDRYRVRMNVKGLRYRGKVIGRGQAIFMSKDDLESLAEFCKINLGDVE